RPAEAELGVVARLVLELEVVFVAEQLRQLFAQLGIGHLRGAEHAAVVEAELLLGLLLRRQRGRAEQARWQEARRQELLERGRGLLGPLLNLGRDQVGQARYGGGAGLLLRRWFIVLQAQHGGARVLEGVKGRRRMGRAAHGSDQTKQAS